MRGHPIAATQGRRTARTAEDTSEDSHAPGPHVPEDTRPPLFQLNTILTTTTHPILSDPVLSSKHFYSLLTPLLQFQAAAPATLTTCTNIFALSLNIFWFQVTRFSLSTGCQCRGSPTARPSPSSRPSRRASSPSTSPGGTRASPPTGAHWRSCNLLLLFSLLF